MIAIKILEVRKFMKLFLAGTLFDEFRMAEGQITTFCTFTIDGHYERAFFGEEEDAGETEQKRRHEYVRWKDLKPRCLDLIRGTRTPLYFRFVFFYPEDRTGKLFESMEAGGSGKAVSSLCLNLRYSGGTLLLTTGVSLRTFPADRRAENIWDDYVKAFLGKAGIIYEEAA